MIVYVSIGNSDDKLSQREWSEFVGLVAELMDPVETGLVAAVHGAWFSRPDAPWQNACWCVEIVGPHYVEAVRASLVAVATKYRQDSIAWAEVKDTEFLGAPS